MECSVQLSPYRLHSWSMLQLKPPGQASWSIGHGPEGHHYPKEASLKRNTEWIQGCRQPVQPNYLKAPSNTGIIPKIPNFEIGSHKPQKCDELCCSSARTGIHHKVFPERIQSTNHIIVQHIYSANQKPVSLVRSVVASQRPGEDLLVRVMTLI